MLNKFMEESAKELVKEFGKLWKLPFAVENELLKIIALRDAEILAKVEIDKKDKENDTLRPDDEKTKVDNSL